MAYLRVGRGRTLLVLPGLATSHRAPSGLDRSFQLRQVRPYAEQHDVWWVQRPQGLGPGTSMARLADAYAGAVLGHLDAPVDVLGFSTGGSVALQLAADHPDVVRRLVLVSSACRLGAQGRRAQRRLAELVRDGRRREAGAVLMSVLGVSRPARRALAAAGWLLGPRLLADDPGDLLATIDAEDGFDLTARLPGVQAPLLVVGGGRDRFYGTRLFAETAAGAPRGELLLHETRGHVGAQSSPLTVARVLAFLG
jgi:pimeloyl-ACP methyl ester carboxylesterase